MKQFNTWERYFDSKHPKHKYQVARHDWFMQRLHGERLLDVGCSGGLALFLAEKKHDIKELHGVDICKDTVELAKKRLSWNTSKLVVIHVGRAEAIPEKDEYFDCVICGETLEHVNDSDLAVSEMSRVIKKGGTLLVSVPRGGHLSKEHIRLFTKESLRKLIIGASFTIVEEGEMKASVNGYYLLLRAIKI